MKIQIVSVSVSIAILGLLPLSALAECSESEAYIERNNHAISEFQKQAIAACKENADTKRIIIVPKVSSLNGANARTVITCPYGNGEVTLKPIQNPGLTSAINRLGFVRGGEKLDLMFRLPNGQYIKWTSNLEY